jgi:hypothetical protein
LEEGLHLKTMVLKGGLVVLDEDFARLWRAIGTLRREERDVSYSREVPLCLSWKRWNLTFIRIFDSNPSSNNVSTWFWG